MKKLILIMCLTGTTASAEWVSCDWLPESSFERDICECQSNPNDLFRLLCYDEIGKSLQLGLERQEMAIRTLLRMRGARQTMERILSEPD